MNRVRAAVALFILGTSVPATLGGQSSSVPDAPAPQAAPLEGLRNQVAPGKGDLSPAALADQAAGRSAAPASPPPQASPEPEQTTPPDQPSATELRDYILHVQTNFVEIPVTVKDKKGHLVSGLTWRDFRVYENGRYQPLSFFTVDPFPMSVAFVIDQSVSADVMSRVNQSLRAIQGALTPYDEIAVFTYNNGPQERTGFTGAQSARLPAVLEASKSSGRDEGVPVNSGPLASGPVINGQQVDPNLSPQRGNIGFLVIPKEVHTLNDAIFAAAKELATREKGRRRIIYVVSDGKESGSKISQKEVIRYLQTYKIAVYGTLVGDSARWGQGYLSRFSLPFQMKDNVLNRYAQATGGSLDAETSVNGMETSYARIAEEARTEYTLGYTTHEPMIDGKYRSIDVRVTRPDLEVVAKPGYYPSAQDVR